MIRSRVENEARLVVHTCTGRPPPDEIIAAMKILHDEKPIPDHLWDIRAVDLSRVFFNHVEDFAKYEKQHVPDRRGGRTAIVTSGALAFGISRMYEMYGAVLGRQVQTCCFESMEDAQDWLST